MEFGGIIVGIYRINKSNACAVAKLMSAIKPDWWDFAGASQQLQDVSFACEFNRLVYWGESKP